MATFNMKLSKKKKVRLEIFLGGDMIFLLTDTVLGMNAAKRNCKAQSGNETVLFKIKVKFWLHSSTFTEHRIKPCCYR